MASVLAIACLAPAHVFAAYTFTKVVDTTTTRPGTADRFTSFSEVYYDGANVAFIGGSAAGTEGVFRWNGTALSTIADTSTAMPVSGTFTDFRALSLDGGAVAFSALGTTLDGVYTTLGGSLRRVADTTTIMPGATVPFTDFEFGTDVEISGNRIAFTAFGTNGFSIYNEGAYLENAGVLQVVADRSDAIPGASGNFIFFSEVDVDSTGVVFDGGRGTGGGNGLYTTNGAPSGSYRIVYNANTVLPGLTQPNSIFSPNSARMDDGKIVFEARGANGYGAIFIDNGGSIETIVSEATPDPVTGSNFVDFYSYTFDNGEAAFMGFSNGPTGMYHYVNGSLRKVVNTLEFLDGKDVSSISLSPGGLNAGTIAFRAAFTDGSSAIYLATPESTGEVQAVSVAPTFDVEVRTGDVFSIEEGSPTLDIDGGVGTSFPVKNVLLEFPLQQIPSNAQIASATLNLDPQTSSGSVSIVVDGYAGDGLASTADVFALTTELAVSPPYTSASNVSIPLNTTFIEALLSSASHLGIQLSSLNPNPLLTIHASESTTGTAPRLMIEYVVPLSQAGDFDGDGDVDGRDLLEWQRGNSPSPHSVADLSAWQANYSQTELSAGLAVPEPGTCALVLCLLVARQVCRSQRAARKELVGSASAD